MPWWEVDVYPVDNRGLPLTEFVLSDARTQLPPAATWDFETPASPMPSPSWGIVVRS